MHWAFNGFNAITPGSILTCISNEVYLELLKKGRVNSQMGPFPGCIKMETLPSNESTEVPFSGTWDSPGVLHSDFHLQTVSAFMLAQCKLGANKRKTEQDALRCFLQHTKMHAVRLETVNN